MIRVDAVGAVAPPRRRAWTVDDTLLYALAVGAGADDLALTTENSAGVDLVALPTLAAVLGGGTAGLKGRLGEWHPGKTVHGTQLIELDEPLPVAGEIEVAARVGAIEDKGSGALIEVQSRAVDAATGRRLFTSTTGLFIRGEGGFDDGGSTGSRARGLAPHTGFERHPDVQTHASTTREQALIYRLCGDRNPLHSDPAFAQRAGFARPILHGLCTWGLAARMLASAALGGDVTRIRSFGGRFRAPVLPGDELTVAAWRSGDDEWRFVVRVEDRTVIDSGILTTRAA